MAAKRVDSKGRKLPDNVTELKNGTYVWRKTYNGRKFNAASKDLGELKRKIIDLEHAIKNGTVEEKNPLAEITMDEWFNKWIGTYKEGVVKPVTVVKYTQNYKKHVSPVFGKMKVKDVKNIHAREFAKSLESKKLCASSVDCILLVLHDMLVKAEENDIIPKIPFRKITSARDKDGTPRRALSVREQKTFLDYLKSDESYKMFSNLFVVMFGTGLRLGEVTGLTENDIDFTKNIISVNHQLTYEAYTDGKCKMRITDPKTRNSTREVPMLPAVKKALQDQIDYVKENIKDVVELDGYKGFLFYNSHGRLIMKKYVEVLIKRIVVAYNENEQEEVEGGKENPFFMKTFTPHEIRHTFATRCMESGMKPKAVQDILGHGSFTTTMNLYTHALKDTKASEIMLLKGMDL